MFSKFVKHLHRYLEAQLDSVRKIESELKKDDEYFWAGRYTFEVRLSFYYECNEHPDFPEIEVIVSNSRRRGWSRKYRIIDKVIITDVAENSYAFILYMYRSSMESKWDADYMRSMISPDDVGNLDDMSPEELHQIYLKQERCDYGKGDMSSDEYIAWLESMVALDQKQFYKDREEVIKGSPKKEAELFALHITTSLLAEIYQENS